MDGDTKTISKLNKRISALTGKINALQAELDELKAKPAANTGHWIMQAGIYYCSVCQSAYDTYENCTELFKHCPNCGAEMGENE